MKKLFMPVAVGVFLAVGWCGTAFAGDDAQRCSAGTLRGRYVLSASGFMISAGIAQPKAIIEVVEFNGSGTLAVSSATRSVGGVITRSAPSVGSYTVTEDCVGTITFDGPTFDIAVSPRGNQLWLIQTTPNNVFEGSGTRISRELSDGDQH